MALFKRRKYAPPHIGSALDPYHYPDDSTGKPAASPSPNPGRRPSESAGPEGWPDAEGVADEPTEESPPDAES